MTNTQPSLKGDISLLCDHYKITLDPRCERACTGFSDTLGAIKAFAKARGIDEKRLPFLDLIEKIEQIEDDGYAPYLIAELTWRTRTIRALAELIRESVPVRPTVSQSPVKRKSPGKVIPFRKHPGQQ